MEEKEEAKELKEPGPREERARSLLNYPEVQKAFVDLAKSQASIRSLRRRTGNSSGTFRTLEKKLKGPARSLRRRNPKSFD